jgi:subtilisin-like proprotein convertase family protein
LFLETQPDLTAGISVNLLPGACRRDYLFVPAGVSNITALANLASGGPLSWQFYRAATLASNCPSLTLPGAPTNASIVIDATSRPPINPGLYVSSLCNLGPGSANVNLSATLASAPAPLSLVQITSSEPMSIADDAISLSTIDVTNTEEVLSTEVGIRIDHQRISDLAISLISPQGTRVLLDENRGGASPEGMGASALVTNVTPVSSTGGPKASTNALETGQTSGTVAINYDFYTLPDDMRIYYEGQLLYDSGLVSFTGSTNINYGPGNSTLVTIIMNEGGNFDTNPVPIYFTFTENTNLTSVPVKFAPVPFTNLTYTAPGIVASNAIYYIPEESLDRLVGQAALGQWTLEIRDSRAGPNSAPPRLVSWQLSFLLENDVPMPVPLVHDQPSTNLLGPGQIQWFSVSPPSWLSFVTNALLSATLPVNVWLNTNTPPTGTNSGDVPLLLGSGGGSYTLQTNAIPPLLPGSSYFLGIQNTNASTVEFVFEVTFDVTNVITLQNGVPYPAMNPGPLNAMDYYRYVVTTNALRAQFEINGPSTNMLLLARKGRLPALGSYDYISANPGTNDQLIVIYNYSSPAALTAGEWFLASVNRSSGVVSYSILATEFSDYGTNLVIMNPAIGANSLCLSWNSLPGIHYYIQAKTNLTDVQWTTVSPTLTAVDVLTTYCIPLPLPFQFFRVGQGLVVTPHLKE